MSPTFMLTFLVVCNLCYLATSLPAHAELSEREIGEALVSEVERALDTLEQVFNPAQRETSPERRSWLSNIWDNVKDYWKENKEEIIATGVKLILGKRQPEFVNSDVKRPLLGSLE